MERTMSDYQETPTGESGNEESIVSNSYDTNSNDSTTNSNDNSTDNGEYSEDIANLSDEEFDKWLESDTDSKQEKQEKNKEEVTKEETPEIDYKAVYEKIFKPFKANGKEIQIRNVDDAINLMQQGANYTKKMQALAPIRRQALVLQNEQIDPDTLNYLIDLKNGDKDAIKKLLKDNKVDLTDFDLDEEIKYTPTKRTISDSQLSYQDVLIESQANLGRIDQILSNFDSASRQYVLNNPRILSSLNYEIETGRMDKILEKLESERVFGRYNGIPDIDACIYIAQGMENEEATKQASTKNKVRPTAGDKRKAAPTKSKPTSTKSSMTPQVLFDMSDEEFEKLSLNDLV